MKPILLLLALSLGACSSGGRDTGSGSPPPATVKMDSSGVVVDTSATR